MRHYLFTSVLTLLLIPTMISAQCNKKPNKEAFAHIRAAETLVGMASTTKDWHGVAEEYERAARADASYAPVLMTLGNLYTRIGNEEGTSAFSKAEHFYNECKKVCADSSDAVDIKLTILNALKRKYEDGPNRFVGLWGFVTYDGLFSKYVEITRNEKGYKFNYIGSIGRDAHDYGFKIISESPNEIRFEFHTIFDKREELRKKGWTHYYDDCNYQADPGYPTSGTYKYDYEDCRYSFSISVSDAGVYINYLEIHADYYFRGQQTYANTETNFMRSQKLVKQ